jgi:inner membrane protein
MDSLTQVVLGASVAEATLGKKLGNRAILWGAVGGTLPDLDVISGAWLDVATSLSVHRGFTHSFLFCFLFAPVMGFVAKSLHKRRSLEKGITFKNWSTFFLWIFLTHALLDSFTTWGTQLFWPFSTYGVAFQSIFVVDPLYTLPFLLLLLVCLFLKPTSILRRRCNYIGLILSTSYLLCTLGNKAWINHQFETSLQELENRDSVTYIRYSSRPTPLNNILWTANVELEHDFLIGYYSLFDKDSSIQWQKIPKNHHYIEDVQQYPSLYKMVRMMNGYYALDSIDGKLVLNDLRFGQLVGWKKSNDPRFKEFVFAYNVDLSEKPEQIVERDKQRDFEQMWETLSMLWERILGIQK